MCVDSESQINQVDIQKPKNDLECDSHEGMLTLDSSIHSSFWSFWTSQPLAESNDAFAQIPDRSYIKTELFSMQFLAFEVSDSLKPEVCLE